MLRIKRLYTFMYQMFLPVFAMTFGICLFIFIIQFLWQHIEKLVGKGLETSIILELFLYASLNLIPMVLPLAILLASLMTFGNMGERLELLAIKASGVSLLKIMKPMIVLIVAISIGCFFFQDRLAPGFRVKAASLLYSIRQKSPELDISEGSFYNDFPGYSIYVKDKDLKTHMLRDVIIYDTSSGGFKDMSVDVCDSAIIKIADSKDHTSITMYSGERFSNLSSTSGTSPRSKINEFVPFMREKYDVKTLIIPFKDDFERIDESRYDDTQISKNLDQLTTSIDSMNLKLDSLNIIDRRTVKNQAFNTYMSNDQTLNISKNTDTDTLAVAAKRSQAQLDIDSLLQSYNQSEKADILRQASVEARGASGTHLMYYHVDTPKPAMQRNIRMHGIFWHRMFSLPFACIVFFFIGAPLGSIIRKGGLGVPVIISVILFIIYYIIDNVGYKMARDGVWEIWQGVWISTGVLFPLGVFLTYKSMNESALFNVELYGKFLRDILKVKSDADRSDTREPSVSEIKSIEELNADSADIENFSELDNNVLKDIVHNYKEYDFSFLQKYLALAILKQRGTYFFDVRVDNNDYQYSNKLLEHYNKNSLYFCIPLYFLTLALLIILPKIAIFSFIAYLTFYIKSEFYKVDFLKSVKKKNKTFKGTITSLVSFILYPIEFMVNSKKMKIYLENIRDKPY